MPYYAALTVLTAKRETTYGTDAAPTGASNAVVAQNVKLSPMEGENVARGLAQPFMGADPTLPAALLQKLSFEVELAPSGTAGTVPAWAELLRACGVAQTINAGVSVIYSPASSAHDSVTIHVYIDGMRHTLTGARGNAKLMVNANQVPKIAFEFIGLFVQPTAVANPALTLTSWTVAQVASVGNTPTITWNGVALFMRSFEMDLGNQLVPRLLIGSSSILIAQRSEKISVVAEAVVPGTLNPYVLAAAATRAALSLVHGVGAGKIATINAPLALLQLLPGLNETDGIIEWPLSFVPLQGATGNDQWTLTLT